MKGGDPQETGMNKLVISDQIQDIFSRTVMYLNTITDNSQPANHTREL